MAAVRLPGIYFETVAPPLPALLPRMDIAAFAGFLPSGPINLPFAVEDPGRFQEIFGLDLPLAWDRQRNEMRMAFTPPAVRSFFRDGGKRCWVVRLAHGALYNCWAIPGLLEIDDFGGYHAGWVQARSEGSWSDGLEVNATLLETPLPAGSLVRTGAVPAVAGLNPGDLVQLYFPSTGTLAYHATSDPRWFWFRQAAASQLAACASPPGTQPDAVFLLGPGEDVAIPVSECCSEGGAIVLHVSRETALSISPGSWLRLQFGAGLLLLQVESIEAGPNATSPIAAPAAALTSTLAWWAADPAAAWNDNRNVTAQVSIVSFQLWAFPQGAPARSIADLGLAADSARFWGLLPTDALLYAPIQRPAPIPYAGLAAEIDHPRFPLAGPVGQKVGMGIPLGMTALVRDDFTQGASLPGQTALDRDGLACFGAGTNRECGEDLFIDPRLARSEAETLLADAFFWQYQANNPGPLTGIYSLLSIDEASLMAVPDATQTGFRPRPAQLDLLAAPDPLQVQTPDASGNYMVSWTSVPGATGYRLDESGDPQFASALTSRDTGASLSIALSSNAQCPLKRYYRASAYGTAGVGPWSATASVDLGSGDFEECNRVSLTAPDLTIFEERNRIVLQWTAAGPSDAFTLQTAGDPQFQSGYTLYRGPRVEFDFWRVPGPATYFRVSRQRAGAFSPWSKTVNTTPEPATAFEVIPETESGPSAASPPGTVAGAGLLLKIHKAMIRMSSARADIVAILGMPLSYRRDEALTYRAMLAQSLASEDITGRMLSYGALYHPWVTVRDNTLPLPLSLRTLPPDGSVSGVIAARALSSGAWVAPANLPINSVLALAPVLQDDAALAFVASQINLIAQEPEGFLVTDQDTLITDLELQPLNVRRLMILLRRLALREGVRYVFQNVGPTFQRSVTRQFEQWMQQLLARGAFAGQSATDSYRVVADATVNTPDNLDQGIFIVELRIAPSRPMRFLTVRLIQTGGTLTLEET
jgi:hypothetical protein